MGVESTCQLPSGAWRIGNTTGRTWHARLRPGLSLDARPRAWSRRVARRVVLTVTDADDPVAGATVRVGGAAGVTNARGRVTLMLGPYDGARRLRAVATKRGYVAAATTLRVRRG